MMNHPQVQQVTPQMQHNRGQQQNRQNQQRPMTAQFPQGGALQNQLQPGMITPDQMMLINSMQALMGSSHPQRATSNQRNRGQNKNQRQEKKRLPSLHIGNLPGKFYDLDLYKMIKQQGFAVVKAIVVVDKKTNKSLNYGYAQFQTEDDAQKAQQKLNNSQVEDKVITVSIQQMDNKPNPKANILVRNLAPAVTQKAIHEHFSKFGEIQKCKLECFADGLSRGFAYVQYT
jgi:RNA recognition motif-containing protein